MRKLCEEALRDYSPTFAYKEIEGDNFSSATYVHPRVQILETEILLPNEKALGLGIVTEVLNQGKRLNICNFHGRWKPGDKRDTLEREEQSKRIIQYFSSVSGPKIIGGDFNLDIETESVRMLEAAGYRNLIREYRVRTTRNRIAWEMYPETPQLHSDFIFVSPDVSVASLEVPEIVISDHLPMILNVN